MNREGFRKIGRGSVGRRPVRSRRLPAQQRVRLCGPLPCGGQQRLESTCVLLNARLIELQGASSSGNRQASKISTSFWKRSSWACANPMAKVTRRPAAMPTARAFC